MNKYLHSSSETNRDLQQSLRERFKVSKETGKTKEHMDSPLKRSEVEGRVERIPRLKQGGEKLGLEIWQI